MCTFETVPYFSAQCQDSVLDHEVKITPVEHLTALLCTTNLQTDESIAECLSVKLKAAYTSMTSATGILLQKCGRFSYLSLRCSCVFISSQQKKQSAFTLSPVFSSLSSSGLDPRTSLFNETLFSVQLSALTELLFSLSVHTDRRKRKMKNLSVIVLRKI